MDIATYSRESALNRDAYSRMREHIQKAFAGQYVALANGQVIGGASTFDAAGDLVQGLDSVPECYLVFPANAEPDFGLFCDLVVNQ